MSSRDELVGILSDIGDGPFSGHGSTFDSRFHVRRLYHLTNMRQAGNTYFRRLHNSQTLNEHGGQTVMWNKNKGREIFDKETKQSFKTEKEIQDATEKRFGCTICMEARFEMVSGSCQHRICSSCLYDKRGIIRPVMRTCPMCQGYGSFPIRRPDVPEDIILAQIALGVRPCKNQECPVELWEWEMDDHLRTCEHTPLKQIASVSSPKPQEKEQPCDKPTNAKVSKKRKNPLTKGKSIRRSRRLASTSTA